MRESLARVHYTQQPRGATFQGSCIVSEANISLYQAVRDWGGRTRWWQCPSMIRLIAMRDLAIKDAAGYVRSADGR